MKVLAVIVGEEDMPENCGYCDVTRWRTDGHRVYCYCTPKGEMANLVDCPQKRQPWCPLKTAAQYAEEVKGA